MGIKCGKYVYDVRDKKKRNLLVLENDGYLVRVYCMKTINKFWVLLKFLKLSPIPWEK
jgi:hypothetical protein